MERFTSPPSDVGGRTSEDVNVMRLHCLVIALLLWTPSLAQRSDSATPAVPADPIASIIDAFRTHPVVGLGEGNHGNEQGHAFRLALIRDPRFAATVNDIVVEFGNVRYQGVADRFVRGEDVPYASLRVVWQDTTQPHAVWDVPIYEEFFRAVRAVNSSLPLERRLRVLLGDPPINWDRIASREDLQREIRDAGSRDAHPADLIRREVLAKKRRALVIYGDMHLQRTQPSDRPSAGGIVDRLESDPGTRAFTIYTAVGGANLEIFQSDVVTWPRPSLAIVRGTTLGIIPFRSYLPEGPLGVGPDGKPLPEPPALTRPMEQKFDAVLYLGPPSMMTYSRLPRELCADAAYVRMRRERMAMMGPPGSAPSGMCAP
jgi:hypothetical protein